MFLLYIYYYFQNQIPNMTMNNHLKNKVREVKQIDQIKVIKMNKILINYKQIKIKIQFKFKKYNQIKMINLKIKITKDLKNLKN